MKRWFLALFLATALSQVSAAPACRSWQVCALINLPAGFTQFPVTVRVMDGTTVIGQVVTGDERDPGDPTGPMVVCVNTPFLKKGLFVGVYSSPSIQPMLTRTVSAYPLPGACSVDVRVNLTGPQPGPTPAKRNRLGDKPR